MRAGPFVGMFSFHPMHEFRKICDPIARHAKVPVVGENLIRNDPHAMVKPLEAF